MINAVNQFLLILQELSKASLIDKFSPSDFEKSEKTIKHINENVRLFNLIVDNLHTNNEKLTETTLKDLSQSLKQIAEDSCKLLKLLVDLSKRY